MKVLGIYIYESLFAKKHGGNVLFSYQSIAIGYTVILNEIQRQNNDLETLVCSLNANIEDVLKGYDIEQYDLACFTTITSQMYYTYKFARKLKKLNKNIKIIVGGPHSTLYPEDIAKHKEIDGIAIGEGVESIKLYLRYLRKEISVNQVDGYWIREGNKVIKNKKIEFINFEKFPIVDVSIWDKWIVNKKRHTILISRGCVNRCSYCSNHKIKLGNIGTYLSFRKVEDIIKELSSLYEKYKDINNVILEMETATINFNYTFHLLSELKKFNKKIKNQISFTTNIHFTPLLKKNIKSFSKALRDANVNLVCIGLESGSYRIRKNILHRPEYKNEEFIDICKELMNNDVGVCLFVLLGLPTETEYNLKQTMSILDKIKPTEIRANIFYPYPNTDLYDLMVKMKIIKPEIVKSDYPERRVACIDYPNLSREIIQKYYDKLDLKQKRFDILSKMLLNNKR